MYSGDVLRISEDLEIFPVWENNPDDGIDNIVIHTSAYITKKEVLALGDKKNQMCWVALTPGK